MEQKKLLTWEDTIHADAELKIAFSFMVVHAWRTLEECPNVYNSERI